MKPNIYVDKCVVDDGTAPCVDRGLLSMTVCKPKVRTSAKIGDILIAFGTNRHDLSADLDRPAQHS